MKAVIKRVGAPPVEFDGDVSYEFMRSVVGGDIQMVPIGPEVEVVCNEEGMFAGPNGEPLPQNAAGYLGDILVVAMDSNEGECRDMTPEETRKVLTYLTAFSDVLHPMHSGEPTHGIIVGKEAVDAFMKAKTESTLGLWDAL